MILLLPLLFLGVYIVVREVGARLAGGGDALLATAPPWSVAVARPVPDRVRAIAVLAVAEAKRMLLHPAIVVGLLFATITVGGIRGSNGFDKYIALTGGGPFALYLPPLTYLAANLAASRTRRSRSAELVDATAATPTDRTLAFCLAALGPMAASVAILAAGYVWFTLVGPPLPATPPFWQLTALPLSVLGAGTLGVMVARWLPFRGAALVVFVGIAFASMWAGGASPMLVTYTEFPEWQANETFLLVPRPAAAHAMYLLGLDTMAAIGALLVHRKHRALLLGLGAVATTGTVVAALLAT